jgi:hypothetical protein
MVKRAPIICSRTSPPLSPRNGATPLLRLPGPAARNPVLTHPVPAGSSTLLFTNTMSQQLRPVVKRARRKAYLKRKKAAAKKQPTAAKK